MKHPHYDMIVAWAAGEEIEYRPAGIAGAYDEWKPVTNAALFQGYNVFRIKPKMLKTVGYRRYLYNNPYNGKHFVHLTHESYVGSGSSSDPEFLDSTGVIWIDTEWQYYTFSEETT